MKKKFDPLVQYYQQRAPEYEQIYYRDFPQKQRELADEAARLRELSAGKRVLDLACGTGYWTRVISDTADSVVASDLSIEMIAEAKGKDYPRPVRFVRSDLYHPPFAEGAFDVLTLGFWFSHEPRQDYAAFFNMLRPLVAPGGLIWMIDNNPPAEGPEMHSVGSDECGNNYKKRYLDSGKAFVILKNYFGVDELREIFSAHFEIGSLIHDQCYWSVVLKV